MLPLAPGLPRSPWSRPCFPMAARRQPLRAPPGETDTDVDRQMARIAELMDEGLIAADLVAAWLSRRVLPLQRSCHRICDMSGRRDPNRISTFQMDMEKFLHRMHTITTLKVDKDFQFGLRAYSRRNPPPVVCRFLRSLILHFCSPFLFFSDLFPQEFVASGLMEDGQARSLYHPDRADWDDVDLEIVLESDSETEARTVTLGARRPPKG